MTQENCVSKLHLEVKCTKVLARDIFYQTGHLYHWKKNNAPSQSCTPQISGYFRIKSMCDYWRTFVNACFWSNWSVVLKHNCLMIDQQTGVCQAANREVEFMVAWQRAEPSMLSAKFLISENIPAYSRRAQFVHQNNQLPESVRLHPILQRRRWAE